MSWINGFLFWSILPLLVSGLLGQLDLALWGYGSRSLAGGGSTRTGFGSYIFTINWKRCCLLWNWIGSPT